MTDQQIDQLIASLDHDGLVRYVDSCCSSRDWVELAKVRDKCRLANDSGRQMWPITTLANYRLALHATPEYACSALQESNSGFLFGPITEVIAQNHTWADLKPHLTNSPVANIVAHERALRGDIINTPPKPEVFDIPASLQNWEPQYECAQYTDSGVTHHAPQWPQTMTEIEINQRPATKIDDTDSNNALRAFTDPWVNSSNGHANIFGVEGDPSVALSTALISKPRIAKIAPNQGLAWLSWAGASGGAHGNRRGMASGRYATWWALATLAGLIDDWPLSPNEIGEIANELNWWIWDSSQPLVGWNLKLIIEDPVDGISWLIDAHDATEL